MSSYAKLYGIDIRKLRTEAPFHPEQISNRWRHEIKAEIYWARVRAESEAEAIRNEAIIKQKNAREYFPQIPGK